MLDGDGNHESADEEHTGGLHVQHARLTRCHDAYRQFTSIVTKKKCSEELSYQLCIHSNRRKEMYYIEVASGLENINT